MLITRRSPLTGKLNEMDLPISEAQIEIYTKGGILIQDAFPGLTPDQREFFKTGYTPEDWARLFPEEDE
jgi:hypothetical protein